MKRVICDQCRAEVEPDAYGIAPNGWLAITVRGIYPAADYCSKACAIVALTEPPAVPESAATESTVQ
jgi:hypothetical protein